MNHQEIILKEVMSEHEVDITDCQIIEVVRSLRHIWEPEKQVSATPKKEYVGVKSCLGDLFEHIFGSARRAYYEDHAALQSIIESLIDKNR